MAGIRIATTPLAALGVIPYACYVAYEALGALVWAAAFLLLGYGLGGQALSAVRHVGWVTAATVLVAVLLAAGPFAYRRWRAKLARSGSKA